MSHDPRSGAAPRALELSSVATPKQARSRETLRRLLDAAEALIDEKGLEQPMHVHTKLKPVTYAAAGSPISSQPEKSLA